MKYFGFLLSKMLNFILNLYSTFSFQSIQDDYLNDKMLSRYQGSQLFSQTCRCDYKLSIFLKGKCSETKKHCKVMQRK